MIGVPVIKSLDEPEHFGWILAIPEDGADEDNHLIPGCDIQMHNPSEKCWCRPLLVDHEQAGLCYQHNALDKRDQYFSGAKKLN